MNLAARLLSCCALAPLALGLPAPAHAGGFDLLRSENRHAREGNQRLAAGDEKAALAAYDRAARELPSDGGVHLNRGLALLRSGQLGPARDALRLANQPSAAREVRADAAYDLGITFYREADGLAGENKHEEAQKLFREAADAFKQALHVRPGDRNAGWNYELAKRRIREQEEKQKQEDEKEKQEPQEQKQDEDQPQEQDPSKQQDPQQQNPQQQDTPEDQAKKDGDQKPEPKPEQQAQKPEQPQPEQRPQDQPQEGEQAEPQPADQQVAPEVSRALDALEDGEQNLERVRALNRAARERRKPEKDW